MCQVASPRRITAPHGITYPYASYIYAHIPIIDILPPPLAFYKKKMLTIYFVPSCAPNSFSAKSLRTHPPTRLKAPGRPKLASGTYTYLPHLARISPPRHIQHAEVTIPDPQCLVHWHSHRIRSQLPDILPLQNRYKNTSLGLSKSRKFYHANRAAVKHFLPATGMKYLSRWNNICFNRTRPQGPETSCR